MQKHSCSLELVFWECSILSKQIGKGAEDLFSLLSTVGGEMLRYYPPPKVVEEYDQEAGAKLLRFVSSENEALQVHPDPGKEIDDGGNLVVGKKFAHRLLKKSSYFDCEEFRGFNPTGDLTYLQKSRIVGVSQLGIREDPSNLDAIAGGQSALGECLYPRLRPKYGWIDEMGSNVPGATRIMKTGLKYIFWANFFGPAYVEMLGREFLLAAPGWKKQELEDGGILYVLTKSYVQSQSEPAKEALDYFREQIPSIKLYRAKKSRD